MKLTVLSDNMTRIDAYYLAEPGVSYYIECDGKKILFDTGYSDVYVQNAKKLGIDLQSLDAVVLSHGHNDHTGGLVNLPPELPNATIYAHPDVFAPIDYEGDPVGSPMSESDLSAHYSVFLSKEPVFLTEHLVYLGQIPRRNSFESKTPIGKKYVNGKWEPDFLPDDSALAYIGTEGLTIITACSHAGICNITEYAKDVCKEDRIAGIIGGFHLMSMSDQVEQTVEYLKKQHPQRLCPCHCTCFAARVAINNAIPVTEVCSGDVFKFT